jgi:uncharacterized protein (DUF1800 family)
MVAPSFSFAGSKPSASVHLPKVVGISEVGHLLRRVAFGFNDQDAKALLDRPLEKAVDSLLSLHDTDPSPLPSWFVEPPEVRKRPDLLTDQEKRAIAELQRQRVLDSAQWWMARMMTTKNPVLERMTLFWHGHFTSSAQKVHQSHLMLRQNEVWRSHAMGNLLRFANDMVKNPAMILFLDANRSTSKAPNENFARELMELFLLGEGHYTEQDVKEAARALTGLSVLPREGFAFTFQNNAHDAGVKTIFGKSGKFTPEDVVSLILARKECAHFIARELAQEVVGPNVDEASISSYAKDFWESGYEIRTLLKSMLMSSAFWNPVHRGTVIKSPAALVVEMARAFRVPKEAANLLFLASNRMGQTLLSPPNVRGWPGGNVWINSQTLVARRDFVSRLMGNAGMAYPQVVLDEDQKASLARAYLAVDVDASVMNGRSYALFLADLFGSTEFQVS